MRRLILPLFIAALGLGGCGEGADANKLSGEVDVIIQTELGEIGLNLYDDAPIHRDNFLKLIREKFYDSLYFHRVIIGFMIQAGDPGTRNGDFSGPNGPGYDLEAELSEKYVHTAGKLGAAREPDEQNPERRSAGSQFYIITGREVSPGLLDSMAQERTKVLRGDMYEKFQTLADSERSAISFQEFLNREQFRPFEYTQEQRDSYFELGGAPHLDFTYTIFGEVAYGMNIVRRIAAGMTHKDSDHPVQPVRILAMQIVAEMPQKANEQ